MMKAGTIEPPKVVSLALQGAAPIAGLMVIGEAMVAVKVEKSTEEAIHAGAMHGADF